MLDKVRAKNVRLEEESLFVQNGGAASSPSACPHPIAGPPHDPHSAARRSRPIPPKSRKTAGPTPLGGAPPR
jgi:hypothetical protein